MKILVTGGCGFVGANICISLKKKFHEVVSLDNLSRKSSIINYDLLKKNRIKNFKFDIINEKKIQKLKKFDLIIDCCAEAAVEVSKKDINRVFNTNLIGTFNLLKKAKKDNSKIIFISTSRVNSISEINNIIKKKTLKKKIKINKKINENFDTLKPKSLYGFTKFASELLIEEFSFAFGLKYIINRCGVISGPMQFGKQDQGFVSLWVWRHILNKNLNYIGYGGHGNQVRDVLHIDDFVNLINLQIKNFNKIYNKKICVGGSSQSNTSLKNLSFICQKLTGNKLKFSKVKKTSIYDIPYFITNNALAYKIYKWQPKKNIVDIVKDNYKWLIENKKILLKIDK
jgi:CDP-paratose 2-epimerase